MNHTGVCSGHCCQNITIKGLSKDDLRAAYLAWLNDATTFMSSQGVMPVMQDIFILYPMLFPVGMDADGKHVFSCKHFDEKTRLCTIYEIRPTMCRRYPNNNPCRIGGCTMEPA